MFEKQENHYRFHILQKHENLIRVYDYFYPFPLENEHNISWTDFLLQEIRKFHPEVEEVRKGFDYDYDRYVEYLIHPTTTNKITDLEKWIKIKLDSLYTPKWISLQDRISRKLQSDRTYLCKAILSAHNGNNKEEIMHLLETRVFI